MARQLILGTAGHIDHGKTSLVRTLTGVDTDRLPAEKKRGITIDIGFADLTIGGTHFGIVDVPGHERFVRNMLAGAVGIDVALLVVAADDSVMPQTREHLAIMQMLGISRGVVALTKSDMIEPSWLELVEADIRELVAGTFLEGADIVATSATTGAGLDELRESLEACAAGAPGRDDGGPFRLAVDRSFVLEGRGTVVTGTAWSGSVCVGDSLDWLPARKQVRVRAIQSHGESVESASAGQRVALNLSGVHHSEIMRGHELATIGKLEPARLLTVRLDALEDSPRPIRHRARVRLHIGSAEVMASVRLLRGAEVLQGQSEFAHVLCAQPVTARCGQPFVIRGESPVVTLGGGIVLQPSARPISRRDSESINVLAGFLDSDATARVETAVYFRAARTDGTLDLWREAGMDNASEERVLGELRGSEKVVEIASGPDSVSHLHRDRLGELSARVLAAIERLHSEAPLEPAVPRSRLAAALSYLNPFLVDGLVARLGNEGKIRISGDRVALSTFKPALTEAQIALCDRVVRTYLDAAFRPPLAKRVAEALGVRDAELAPVLQLCTSRGDLVAIGGGFYLHADRERDLRRRIVGRIRASGGMGVSQIKDELDSSRKYAVPICEYLDRIGVTRRVGDVRMLGPHADAVPPKTD